MAADHIAHRARPRQLIINVDLAPLKGCCAVVPLVFATYLISFPSIRGRGGGHFLELCQNFTRVTLTAFRSIQVYVPNIEASQRENRKVTTMQVSTVRDMRQQSSPSLHSYYSVSDFKSQI